MQVTELCNMQNNAKYKFIKGERICKAQNYLAFVCYDDQPGWQRRKGKQAHHGPPDNQNHS